ncbi:hypothetical protein R1flu_012932 [Riccia fluitans]|uniref:Uncharacterized protein n=1 Tax=Riccia fluitans TaxID=41844 RepID=A0ABD1ZC08_9MARC
MNTAEELDEQAGSLTASRNQLEQMAKAERFQAPRVLSVGLMIRMPGFTSENEPLHNFAVDTAATPGSSGVKFLWVLRVKAPHAVESVLPPEFQARMEASGRGFIEKGKSSDILPSGNSFPTVAGTPPWKASALAALSSLRL